MKSCRGSSYFIDSPKLAHSSPRDCPNQRHSRAKPGKSPVALTSRYISCAPPSENVCLSLLLVIAIVVFILHILIVLAGGIFPFAGRLSRKPRKPQDSRRPRNSLWEDNRFPHDCPNSQVSVLGQGNKALRAKLKPACL